MLIVAVQDYATRSSTVLTSLSISLFPFVRNECLPTCESSHTSTLWRGEEVYRLS